MQFNEFANHFCKIINTLLEPLSEVAWAVQEDSDSEPDVLEDLYFSFWTVGACMCGADSRINMAEAKILCDFEKLFPGKESISPEIIQKALGEMSAEQWMRLDLVARLKPSPLRLLEAYDSSNGTNMADPLRHLYLSFAVLMANADSDIQRDESDFLAELKSVLYENDTSTLSPIDSISDETSESKLEIRSTSRSLEDALSELENLVGLAPVKSEVGSLVNLLKINGMRKERGLPVLQASNHLVFYGNPGTGKTTIARLTAEIYKGLEVITKGHLVETDRSGLVAGYLWANSYKG
jgi:ATPase family associated with various cellular activities (AAA)